MAVVEYKMHIVGNKGQRTTPNWVREGGQLGNPADHSFVGWVVENAEYYVPDTLTTLTKAALVTRQLGIHAVTPERIYTGDIAEDVIAQQEDAANWRDKTDAEVTADTETWYDDYVTRCQGIVK